MTAKKKTAKKLRSYLRLGKDDMRAFEHRSRLQQSGYDRVNGLDP